MTTSPAMQSPTAAMPYTQVIEDDILAAAQYTDTVATEVQNELNALYAWLYELEDTWKGMASSTFTMLMQDFSAYAGMINNALVRISQALKQNAENYGQTEQTNVANLKLLSDRLPITPSSTPAS